MATAGEYLKNSNTNGALIGAVAGLVVGLTANFARKAVAQSMSSHAGQWDEVLAHEHKAVLALFDKIEETTNEQVGKRKMLLMKLKVALTKHALTEENVVYPALRDHSFETESDNLNREHGLVKHHLFELAEMKADTKAWLDRVRKFRAEIEEHMREEEEQLFPKLRSDLGVEGNKHITLLTNKEGFMAA